MITQYITKGFLIPISILLVFSAGSMSATTKTPTQDEVLNERNKQSKVVNTVSGPIQGEIQNEVIRFLGIPYAQSIEGRNRFAPPQPVEPWADVRQMDRYADSCPQQEQDPRSASPFTPAFQPPDYVEIGDDCLALNVWTPEEADGSLPVMVWLHGGGWTSGSGSPAIYGRRAAASCRVPRAQEVGGVAVGSAGVKLWHPRHHCCTGMGTGQY